MNIPMSGRVKSARLCVVFWLAGVLTLICIVRVSKTLPPNVNHYLDVVMTVQMVLLLLCVLEQCLGVQLCSVWCFTSRCGAQDDDEEDDDSFRAECGEAPPSYDMVKTQSGATAEGGQEKKIFKDRFNVYFKRHRNEERRSSVASGSELWLSVDSLPSYEEALAHIREKEAMIHLPEDRIEQLQEEMVCHEDETPRRPEDRME